MSKLLFFGDDPMAKTGFGIVNKYIIQVLIDHGFDILHLARNPTEDKTIRNATDNYHVVDIPVGSNPFRIFDKKVKKHRPEYIFIQEDLNMASMLIFGTNKGSARSGKIYEGIRAIRGYNPKIIWVGPHDSLSLTEVDDKFVTEADLCMSYTEGGNHILSTGTKPFRLGPSVPIIEPEKKDPFKRKFLTIAYNRYKKRLDVIVNNFIRHHIDYPNDVLTIKTAPGGYYDKLFNLDKPYINVITDVLTNSEIAKLYATHDHYICSTANEGWGLPLTNATHYGMTITAPDFYSHWESTGGIFNPIPVFDICDTDGYRILPIVLYSTMPDFFDKVEPNNEKVDYWDESCNILSDYLTDLKNGVLYD